MSAGVFEHPECCFRYPENWKLEQSNESPALEVTVESPDGAFWTVKNFGDSDPADVAVQARDAMQAEYEQLESEQVEDTRFDAPLLGFNLDFYCLDLVVESHIRTLRANENSYLIMYQAEDRDFQALQPVFAAITKTLLDSFGELALE